MSYRSPLAKVAARKLNELKAASGTLVGEQDPVIFAREQLGVAPWSKQEEVLRAAALNSRVAVRSGHKIGKSLLAAILALWWYATKPRARVILTSSSYRQVKEVLWLELKRVFHGARQKLDGSLHDSPDAGLQALDGRQIIGFSTDSPERMAGISGANLLFIVDEASGFPESVFEAIEGNALGGAHILLLGNPTQPLGTFYQAFTTKRQFWTTFHISSEESPNVVAGKKIIPGLATREDIEQMRAKWGEENPIFQVRVKGNFPSQAEDQVVGLALVEGGSVEWRPPTKDDGPLEIGVDVARYGDDETVIQPRRGRYVYRPTILHSMDTVEVAERVAKLAIELRDKTITRLGKDSATGADVEEVKFERPRVKVDVIGVGAGVVDTLKHSHKDVVEVVPVNVAESATDETYFRLRDQLWFAIRDWLKDGGKFATDDMLIEELLAPRYRVEARGQLRVESKDEIKAKIERSPDRADALALAVYSPPRKAARVAKPQNGRPGVMDFADY